jgi:NitT/TauT family transport system ATP-binding protein
MLFPWLTTLDNVLYGPRARGDRGPVARERALDLLKTVGLADAASAYPHELSGGMQHRAAFARVLVNNPRLLLMDEPFGALDAITRTAMQHFLLRLWERDRMTVLFVTHDVEEAVFISDRVLVMTNRPGRIKDEIRVPLARPRNHQMLSTPAFLEARWRVLESIRSESLAVAT